VVDEILDHAGVFADDRGVRLAGEVTNRRRMPVVAAGQTLTLVHALLNHRPFAGAGHHERVQVDLEAVGNRVVVDPGRQPAGSDELAAVQPRPIGKRGQLTRRLA
jgi:hypothetical protein